MAAIFRSQAEPAGGSFCYRGLSEPFRQIGGLAFAFRGRTRRKTWRWPLPRLRLLRLDDDRSAGIQAVLPSALRRVRWPGRLELLHIEQPGAVLQAEIAGTKSVLLDGAHNPAGVQALARPCRLISPGARFSLLWGAMLDKDIAGSLSQIAGKANRIYLTGPKGERSASPEHLFSLLPENVKAQGQCLADSREALIRALRELDGNDIAGCRRFPVSDWRGTEIPGW